MGQRADLLRKIMESKNMKVADIVKLSGVPYSTVKAILERGAEKAGYVNVCKICSALGISADELEEMVKNTESIPTTIAAHKDGENFTPEEMEKIEEYKKLLIAARPRD